MTAPSLILLGHGSNDPRVAQVSHEIRAGILEIRSDLDISIAFFDHYPPTGVQVVNQLAKRGVSEVVFVPLLLSDAFQAHAEVPALVAQVQAAHPDLRVMASRPIGPEAQLLGVIDRRLRDVLRARRVSELDALVFAAAGSPDVRSNAIVARRARQWSTHHRLPCVTAFATGSARRPQRRSVRSGPRDAGTLRWAAGSSRLASCSPGRPNLPTITAQWRSPIRWEPSRRSPRSPCTATWWLPWTWSMSTPVAADDIELAPVRHLSSVG